MNGLRAIGLVSATLTALCSFFMWFLVPLWFCLLLLVPLGLSYILCSVMIGEPDRGD